MIFNNKVNWNRSFWGLVALIFKLLLTHVLIGLGYHFSHQLFIQYHLALLFFFYLWDWHWFLGLFLADALVLFRY